MKDAASKRSRGFGFIVFASPSAVDRVLNEKELRVDGRKVRFPFIHMIVLCLHGTTAAVVLAALAYGRVQSCPFSAFSTSLSVCVRIVRWTQSARFHVEMMVYTAVMTSLTHQRAAAAPLVPVLVCRSVDLWRSRRRRPCTRLAHTQLPLK